MHFILTPESITSWTSFIFELSKPSGFFISIAIALTSSFKINDFTILIFGKGYGAAAIPALLLFWAQTFLFFNFFSLDLLTARNVQKWNLVYAALVLVVNLLVDILLIPLYSYNGVGFAKIVAAIFGTIFLCKILTKINIAFNFYKLNTFLWLVGVSILLYVLSIFSLFIYMTVSIIVVLLLTYYLNFFNNGELILILKFINREKWISKLIKI